MEEEILFRKKFTTISLLITLFVSILLTCVMLTYASQKTIIENADESEQTENAEVVPKNLRYSIDMSGLWDEKTDHITIHTPFDAPNVSTSVSTVFSEQKVTIFLSGVSESYFHANAPRGMFSHVKKMELSVDEAGTSLIFSLDGVFIPIVSYEGSDINLSFMDITKIDETIFAIDPFHGGANSGIKVGDLAEKDVVLNIALKVKELTIDKPYLVLLIRGADDTINTEGRIESVENIYADYYVGLHLSANVDDVKEFGMKAYYNSTYFFNGLESIDIADILLSNVVSNVKNKAIGLEEAGDSELILKVLNIPGTVLSCGYLSNSDEAMLLADDDYVAKIAEGIVASLDEIYSIEEAYNSIERKE